MRTIAVIIAIIAISGLAFAQDTADRQNRVVLEVIPLQYLDVQTAIAIFGGTIIPSYGQRMLPAGPRGGYGGGYGYQRSGTGIGGSYTTPRGYGSQSGYNPIGYRDSSNRGSYGYNYFR